MEGKGIEELMFVSIYSFLHVSVDTEKLAYGSNFEIHAFIYSHSIKKNSTYILLADARDSIY